VLLRNKRQTAQRKPRILKAKDQICAQPLFHIYEIIDYQFTSRSLLGCDAV